MKFIWIRIVSWSLFLLSISIVSFPVVNAVPSLWTVDECVDFRKWHYNEEYGVWVGEHTTGLVRCEQWSKRDIAVLAENDNLWKAYIGEQDASDPIRYDFSAAPPENYFSNDGYIFLPTSKFGGIIAPSKPSLKPFDSTRSLFSRPIDAVLECRAADEGKIVYHGNPQRDREQDWLNRCSYMPSVGITGRYGPTSGLTSPFGPGSSGVSYGTTPDPYHLIYTGGGLGVPSQDYQIKGISKVTDLKALLIGWTNFLMPYVSIISIFALVAAGMFYLTSFVNDDLHTKAKSILMYVVIGIVLILSAFTIVSTLLSVTVK